MADHLVVWNGSKDHPGGRQLFVEEEERVAARQRPYRTVRELNPSEVESILNAARFERHTTIAVRFHVSTCTVDHLVHAAAAGLLVKS